MPTDDELRKALGAFGETYACHQLVRAGYTILERNVRLRGCELDIVARNRDELVFVEVKTRRPSRISGPADAVNRDRMSHVERAIDQYLTLRDLEGSPYRIEVVAIEVDGSGKVGNFEILGDVGIR